MERAAEISLLFEHTRPDGTRCFTAFENGSGYTYTWEGENIAYNYSNTPQYAFDQWKEQNENYAGQGHRRNMLNTQYNAIGIAQVVYLNRH